MTSNVQRLCQNGISHLLSDSQRKFLVRTVWCYMLHVMYESARARRKKKPLSIVLIHLVSYLLRSLDPLRRDRDRRLWLPLRERFDLKQEYIRNVVRQWEIRLLILIILIH